MNINQVSAKIQVAHPGANPGVFVGPKAITFHLTRGHIVEGDTETFNDAINFIGTVQATTSASEFATWKFGFLQFQKVGFLGMFYAGSKRKSGQITLIVDRAPAMTKRLHLDSEPEYSPWTHSFDATYSGGKITAISGDHPASRAPRKMTNNKTNAYNFLFHLIDVRRFWTVFSAEDPAGNFHHLAHVSWNLRYDFKFVWRNGIPQVHQSGSRFSSSNSEVGAPSEQALKEFLNDPKPPHANLEVRKAIRHAVLGGPPNRSDSHERQYNNLPRQFYT